MNYERILVYCAIFSITSLSNDLGKEIYTNILCVKNPSEASTEFKEGGKE